MTPWKKKGPAGEPVRPRGKKTEEKLLAAAGASAVPGPADTAAPGTLARRGRRRPAALVPRRPLHHHRPVDLEPPPAAVTPRAAPARVRIAAGRLLARGLVSLARVPLPLRPAEALRTLAPATLWPPEAVVAIRIATIEACGLRAGATLIAEPSRPAAIDAAVRI